MFSPPLFTVSDEDFTGTEFLAIHCKSIDAPGLKGNRKHARERNGRRNKMENGIHQQRAVESE